MRKDPKPPSSQDPSADAYGSILLAMHRSANFMERRADNHLVMTYGEKRHHRLITQMLAGSPVVKGNEPQVRRILAANARIQAIPTMSWSWHRLALEALCMTEIARMRWSLQRTIRQVEKHIQRRTPPPNE